MGKTLKLAGIIKESIVDGPGIRITIFVQGCPHHKKAVIILKAGVLTVAKKAILILSSELLKEIHF